MAYVNKLNKKDRVAWEDFKNRCGIGNSSVSLGNCGVLVSYIKDKIYLEIMPNETTNFNSNVEGIIVAGNEDDYHVDSIMKMAKNASEVKNAKLNKKPIKVFVQ